MKKYLVFGWFLLCVHSQLLHASESWRLNVDPLEVGALVGKFGVTACEENEKQSRTLLLAIAALRFYQTVQKRGDYNIGSMVMENAIVIFGRELFMENRKKNTFSYEEEQNEKKTNWSTFWKLFKADLFGTFLGYFCQMNNTRLH